MLATIISALSLILLGALFCYGIYFVYTKLGIIAIIILAIAILYVIWLFKKVNRRR